MPNLTEHPIQRHIIGLALSIIAIVAVLIVIHTTLREKSSQIELQLNNQIARQDIGVSIYQRLFAAKATIFKLSTLDNQLELDIVKRRFDANLHTIKNGLSVLQNGGVFKDAIATNIPGQDIMDLVATYKKPDSEGYILEVLELGPAIHNLEKQSQLLCQLIQLQISTPESLQSHVQSQIDNLMKTINAIQRRTQENAARILYDSQARISSLSTQLKQAEQLHDKFRLPVVILALSLAGYLLIITLTRVGRVIANRKQAEDQLQLLLDTTAEGIYGIDIHGNTTFVNPAASRMLGYRQDDKRVATS